VHREQLVVHLGRNELAIWRRQLCSQDGGLKAANDEEEQAGGPPAGANASAT
jgi:hypothetical protein